MNKRVTILTVGAILIIGILAVILITGLALSNHKSDMADMGSAPPEQSTPVRPQSPASPAEASVTGNCPPSSSGQAVSNDTQLSVKVNYSVLYSAYGSEIKILSSNDNVYVTSLPENSIDINTFKKINIMPDDSKLLVNEDSPLSTDYFPDNLVNADPVKIKPESSGIRLQPITAKALYSMLNAAAKDNVKGFVLNSAYRSKSSQKAIFDYNLSVFRKSSKTYNEALIKTHQLVAAPGYSEHQTGLALDIFSVNGRHRTDFRGTKEQLWLETNAYNYGFILRYNKNKTQQTGATYEPWHFRYTGLPLSTYLHDNDLCLEEFYEKIFSGKILEGTNCIFIQIGKDQKVFSDSLLYPKLTLEPVREGVLLLTINTEYS